MRISGSAYVVDIREAQAMRREQPAAAAGQATAPARQRTQERVEISPQAREMQRLKQQLDALPDVRLDQVALAKQNLQGGYRVSPAVLAQSMMDSYDSGYLKGEKA